MAPQNLAKANERRSATLAYLLGFTPGLIERMQQILTDPEAKDRDVIAVAKLILDVLIPVGYQPRSQYAFTDDEIAEIEDLPDVAADIEDLPDVVA